MASQESKWFAGEWATAINHADALQITSDIERAAFVLAWLASSFGVTPTTASRLQARTINALKPSPRRKGGPAREPR